MMLARLPRANRELQTSLLSSSPFLRRLVPFFLQPNDSLFLRLCFFLLITCAIWKFRRHLRLRKSWFVGSARGKTGPTSGFWAIKSTWPYVVVPPNFLNYYYLTDNTLQQTAKGVISSRIATCREQATTWAEAHGLRYIEVSAKNGDGVGNVFRTIGKLRRGDLGIVFTLEADENFRCVYVARGLRMT
jgi:hypothetical protein